MTERDHATLPAADEPTNSEDSGVTNGQAEETDTVAAALGEAAPVAGDSMSGIPVEADNIAAEVAPEPEPTPEPGDAQWAEATGAVVLGVLGPDDMAAAGQAIARSRSLQKEVAALLPVADILLNLYQTQPAPAATAVASPIADRPAPDRTAPAVSRRTDRPRPVTTTRRTTTGFGEMTAPTILIGVFALAAAIGLLWALALRDTISTRNDEIAALKRQVTEFRQAANASAFSLTPSEDDAENARGTVFYSIADSTVLIDVTGLPELDEDRVYQVWFQRTGGGDWEPGPTFLVNEDGESVQRLPGETPTFIRIAISEEPAPGSAEPSGSFLLEGALAGANG